MKPIIYDGCQLFTFDLKSLKFGVIDPAEVGVKRIGKRFYYFQINGNSDLLIVQALNIKKAAAKMIDLIYKK